MPSLTASFNEPYPVASQCRVRIEQSIAVLECKVFGSSARGDADEDSDLDLFVAVEEVTPEVRDIVYDAAFEIGFENNLVITPLLFSRAELAEGSPMRHSTVLRSIEREGIPV